jgi:hypothetical protein
LPVAFGPMCVTEANDAPAKSKRNPQKFRRRCHHLVSPQYLTTVR